MKLPRANWREVLTKALILVCGALAALLLSKNGSSEALPFLAVGGSIGACLVTAFQPAEEE